MQSLRPLGQLRQVSVFQCLGEGIEQRPDVARFEGGMPWLAPLVKDTGNVAVGAHPDINAADDEDPRVCQAGRTFSARGPFGPLPSL